MEKNQLIAKLKEVAPTGKISCPEARQLAEKMGVPYSEVGRACDEAKIKLYGCDLGCF